MVKIQLVLPDGRVIIAKINNRHYRKIVNNNKVLPFWKRIKNLFKKGK